MKTVNRLAIALTRRRQDTLELFHCRFVVNGIVMRPMTPLRRSVSLPAGVSLAHGK
jgi:hypothetical protein